MTLDITKEMVIAFLVVLRYFQSKMGFIYKRSQLRIMLIGQCRCSLRIQPHKVLCQFPSVNMHLLMTTLSSNKKCISFWSYKKKKKTVDFRILHFLTSTEKTCIVCTSIYGIELHTYYYYYPFVQKYLCKDWLLENETNFI